MKWKYRRYSPEYYKLYNPFNAKIYSYNIILYNVIYERIDSHFIKTIYLPTEIKRMKFK